MCSNQVRSVFILAGHDLGLSQLRTHLCNRQSSSAASFDVLTQRLGLPTGPVAPPPPPPKINLQITPAPVTVKGEIKSSPVTLNIDGHAIANAIIPFIMGEMRSMINFSGHNDTQVYQPAPPGAYGLPVR